MNRITIGWKNSQKLPKKCKNWILPVFGRFLCPGRSDWFLVFCIFSGSLRHKFRVSTRHTLKKFFFCVSLNFDRKERHFGNASSGHFEFLFVSGVHIATCAQNSGLALFKCWKKCFSLCLTLYTLLYTHFHTLFTPLRHHWTLSNPLRPPWDIITIRVWNRSMCDYLQIFLL